MLELLLQKFNRYRKEQFFRSPLYHTRQSYAFVGVGLHSLTNLYPLLRHFNIRLKYICTKTSDWSRELSPLFPDSTFTHDIRDILQDPELGGVFVCVDPNKHYDLAKMLLLAKKNVFIEKPPCQHLTELLDLASLHPEGIFKCGLQRRYWPGNRYIQKKCRKAGHYNYQFLTGPYPKGDVLTELFLHPLDYSRFLFGDSQLQSFSLLRKPAGTTLQLHLTHENGCSGLLELSTHYSWNPAVERLSVHTEKESLQIEYPASIKGTQLPFRLLNMPTERVLRQPALERHYFSAGASLIPALELNSFVSHGFYQEIETFISLSEGRGDGKIANDLPSLINTYEMIEKIRQSG